MLMSLEGTSGSPSLFSSPFFPPFAFFPHSSTFCRSLDSPPQLCPQAGLSEKQLLLVEKSQELKRHGFKCWPCCFSAGSSNLASLSPCSFIFTVGCGDK